MAGSRLKEVIAEANQADDDDETPEGDTPGTAGTPDDVDEEAESEAAETPPAPEPAPPVEATGLNIGPEEIAKAEKAITGHRKKLGSILGAEAVAEQCFVCAGMGFLPELPPVGATFKVVQDGDDVMLITESPVPDTPLKSAPDKGMCEECDGIGQVLSGSKNPHARVVGCSKCSGNGWVQVARDAAMSTTDTRMYAQTSGAPPNGGTVGIRDAWGREPGHKYWGVPPDQVPIEA